jgi:hypothetical protein
LVELQKFRLRSTSFLGKNTATVFFGSTVGFDVPSVPLALWARPLKGDRCKGGIKYEIEFKSTRNT